MRGKKSDQVKRERERIADTVGGRGKREDRKEEEEKRPTWEEKEVERS